VNSDKELSHPLFCPFPQLLIDSLWAVINCVLLDTKFIILGTQYLASLLASILRTWQAQQKRTVLSYGDLSTESSEELLVLLYATVLHNDDMLTHMSNSDNLHVSLGLDVVFRCLFRFSICCVK